MQVHAPVEWKKKIASYRIHPAEGKLPGPACTTRGAYDEIKRFLHETDARLAAEGAYDVNSARKQETDSTHTTGEISLEAMIHRKKTVITTFDTFKNKEEGARKGMYQPAWPSAWSHVRNPDLNLILRS
jgi:hypothetical protein